MTCVSVTPSSPQAPDAIKIAIAARKIRNGAGRIRQVDVLFAPASGTGCISGSRSIWWCAVTQHTAAVKARRGRVRIWNRAPWGYSR